MEQNNDLINKETTGDQYSDEYKEWIGAVMKAQDGVEQRKIVRDQLLKSDELSDEDKRLFTEVFDYCEKNIRQNKPFDSNLLKIYLQDIKGYDIERINIIRILVLMGLCGFSF